MEDVHFTPKELAQKWGYSPATWRNLAKNEPGVLKLEGLGASIGKRSYTTYSIPESVAARIYQRLGQKALKTKLPRRNPRRIVLLRNCDRAVA